jgi:hypothetical protein
VEAAIPEVMRWIQPGLNVRFDQPFQTALASAQDSAQLVELVSAPNTGFRQAMVDNMDYQ